MLYFITGISRNCLQEENWGQGKIPSGKAGTYSKLMPIFIMFTFKGRNIGADAKVRFDIHGEGDVRLVVVRE